MRKKTLPALRFEPMTFRLMSSCQSINLPSVISTSQINHFAPICSQHCVVPCSVDQNHSISHLEAGTERVHPIE